MWERKEIQEVSWGVIMELKTDAAESSPGTAAASPEMALTFDDVLLVPQHSRVLPSGVDVSGRFTRNIPLNVSAGERRDGHRDRGSNGHCHGAARRHWNHP